MTLRRFEIFVSVAKHLSLTRAAHELHVSQPAISHELKRLQKNIGAALIKKRPGGGIELTKAGIDFRTDVELILSQLNTLRTKFGPTAAKQEDRNLILAASHGLSAFLLPSLMTRFKQAQPSVNLNLYSGTSREIESLLHKGKIDIAIIAKSERVANFASEPFRKEQFSIFVPAGHPLTRMKKITPGELSRVPLVVRLRKDGESRTQDVLAKLRAIGCTPKVSMCCESFDAVKATVKNGAGIGILHRDLLREEVRRKELSILSTKGFELGYTSYILYSKETPLSREAQDFLTLLRAWRTNNFKPRIVATDEADSQPGLAHLGF
jgi:DNA-binding transcriptional LysR family regulator